MRKLQRLVLQKQTHFAVISCKEGRSVNVWNKQMSRAYIQTFQTLERHLIMCEGADSSFAKASGWSFQGAGAKNGVTGSRMPETST